MSETAIGTLGVQERLDALQAERDATWPEEQLAAHRALRESLEANLDRDRLVAVGDRAPAFRLPEVEGGTVALEELLRKGPVVLLFFRFEGCPACNAALPGYQALLAPALHDLGAELVAISPQAPGKLVEIKRRYDLDFPVASDADAALIETLGIGFAPSEAERRQARTAGNDLGETLGTGSWTLPYPTAIVVDTDGIVRFVDTHPNWMVRTEPETILDAVRALRNG